MIKDNNVETTFENIKSYFETYVKTYQPYKDNPVFKALLDTIIDQYKELYIDVPTNLLDLVVKNVITPRTNVDYLLFEIGLPEDLIHKLSSMEKWLFFQVFSDFTRYKSTVNFFQMLCGSAETTFPDKFTLYELWIDRTGRGEWVLKPVVIYRGKYSDITTDPIPYDVAYQKIPSLLISKDQLETWYQNNQIILPFKSNIILLGQYEVTNVSYLSGLIRATFLKQYKNTDISLYFNDNKKFVEQLSLINKLWYYLVCRYYEFSQPQEVLNDVLLFSENNDNVPEISQLDNIVDQFVNINSWDEYYQFIDTYISPFYVDTYLQENFTIDEYHTMLTKLSPLFMRYIDERLSQCEDEKTEIIYLLDEIYGSLIVSLTDYVNDKYYTKYLPVYLETLNRIFIPDVDVSNPKTYTSKVALTLKPFHTEVLLDMYKKIQAENKEFFDDIYLFAMEVNKASVFDISAWEFIAQIEFSTCTSIPLISVIPTFMSIKLDKKFFDYIYSLIMEVNKASVFDISAWEFIAQIGSLACTSIPLISVIPTFMSIKLETISYEHLIQWLNFLSFSSLNIALDTNYNTFLKYINSSQLLISTFDITPIQISKSNYNINDLKYWLLAQNFSSIQNFSDEIFRNLRYKIFDFSLLVSFVKTNLLKSTSFWFNLDDNFFNIPWVRNTNIFTVSDTKQIDVFSLIRDKFPNIRDIVFPMGSSSDQFFSSLYSDLFMYDDVAKVNLRFVLTSLLISSDLLTFYNNIFDEYNWEQSTFLVKYLRWIGQTSYDISDVLVAQIPLTSIHSKINDDDFILGTNFYYISFNITEQYLLQYLLYTSYFATDIAIPIYIFRDVVSFEDPWSIYPIYNFYIPHALIDNIFNFDTQEIDVSILNSISKYWSILSVSKQSNSHIDDTIDSIGNGYFINSPIDDRYDKTFVDSYITSTYNVNEMDTNFTTGVLLDRFEQFSIDDSQYSIMTNY